MLSVECIYWYIHVIQANQGYNDYQSPRMYVRCVVGVSIIDDHVTSFSLSISHKIRS